MTHKELFYLTTRFGQVCLDKLGFFDLPQHELTAEDPPWGKVAHEEPGHV